MEVLKRLFTTFLNHRDQAFYTGTINMLVQLILRGLRLWMPDADFTAFGVWLADLAAMLFVVAAGGAIKNAADAGSPATLTEATIKTEMAKENAVVLKVEAARADADTGGA